MFGRSKVPQRIDYKEGHLINGKYRVEKILGGGAFGLVYLVTDITGQRYALKILRLWDVPSDIRQPLIDRFDMEFQTGRISSKYLVHSLDYGLVEGNPYILMEYCTGGDLVGKMKSQSLDLYRICHDILHGLNDLHVNGKVHRDLKPENVLIKADGTAALTDFGISGDRTKRMTERNIWGKPNQIFGTYAYMPPEQVNRARGGATVLPTTDIFSFGVMIYQLITGTLPYGKLEDENDLVLYQKRAKAGDWDKSKLLSCNNGYLWINIIDGCLKSDYKYRLQNAKEAFKLLPRTLDQLNEQNQSSVEHCQRRNSIGQSMINPVSYSGNHRAHKAVLRIMQGDEYGKIFNLTLMVEQLRKAIIRIGRKSSNDIVLDEMHSSYISRLHCTLETDHEGVNWHIRDGQWEADSRTWLVSSNGTYVNSSKVSGRGFWLESGDIITIGDTKLRFELS